MDTSDLADGLVASARKTTVSSARKINVQQIVHTEMDMVRFDLLL